VARHAPNEVVARSSVFAVPSPGAALGDGDGAARHPATKTGSVELRTRQGFGRAVFNLKG